MTTAVVHSGEREPSVGHRAAAKSPSATSPSPRAVRLTSIKDAEELLSDAYRTLMPAPRTIEVLLPGVEANDRCRVERRLNLWANACGCQAGSLFALAAIVWQAAGDWSLASLSPGSVLNAVGWIFGAALLGKLAGFAAARLLFVLELRRLVRRACVRPHHPAEIPA